MIKTIGDHRLKHGSIMNGLDDLMAGERADVFYCDPPWGAGTLKAFETLNHKRGESAVAVELNSFLVALFRLAVRHSKGLVFIEYGTKWKDMVINAGLAAGLLPVVTFDGKYKSGSKVLPHHIHVFSIGKQDWPTLDPKTFEGMVDAADLTEAVLRIAGKPGQIVLDPCCGLGATGVAAKRLGMRFYGNELTLNRLSRAMKRLS